MFCTRSMAHHDIVAFAKTSTFPSDPRRLRIPSHFLSPYPSAQCPRGHRRATDPSLLHSRGRRSQGEGIIMEGDTEVLHYMMKVLLHIVSSLKGWGGALEETKFRKKMPNILMRTCVCSCDYGYMNASICYCIILYRSKVWLGYFI